VADRLSSPIAEDPGGEVRWYRKLMATTHAVLRDAGAMVGAASRGEKRRYSGWTGDRQIRGKIEVLEDSAKDHRLFDERRHGAQEV
jgi:hypothetical protein